MQSQLGGSADVTFDPATGIITGTIGGLLAGGREGAMVNGVTVVATDSTGIAMSDDNNAVNFAHVVVKGLSGVKNEGETFTEAELKKLIRFRTWMGTSYGEEPLDYLMKNGNVFSNRNFYKAENSTLVAIKPFHDFVQKMEILTPIASTGTNNTATIRVTYGNTMTGDVLGSMDYTVNYGYSVAPSVTPINPVVAVNPGVTYSPAANVTIADQDNSGYRSQTVEVTVASGSVVYAGALGDFTAPTTEGTYTVKVSVTDNSATQYNGKNEDIGYDEATPKTVKLLDKDIHDLSASGTYQLIVAKQKANIKFVNDTEPTVAMTTVSESGNNGDAIPTVDYKTTLNDYLKAGYSVKSDNFTGGKTFDTDFDTDQEFTVVLKERIEPFDPANPPVPEQPVDPNDPNSPRWPDNVKDQKGTETVTRIIRYVYAADGSQASAPVSETLTFTRQAKVNLVTGEVAFGEWTATDTTFDVVVSPVINSYITDRKEVPAKTGVQATDADSEEIVKYTKLGRYVPNMPVLNFPDNPYPNDPTDSTKPKQPGDPDYPVIPDVPGMTPKDPNGTPLTPVDPNDPSKGYIPPIPEDPTEDTPINYEKDDQKAIINFVTETGRQLSQLTEAGKSEEAIPSANYTAALVGYLKAGYALVSDDFRGYQVFDKNQLVDQTFTVVLKERIEPFDPANPPVPDQPVNPNDPNSPKWPSTVENQQGTEAVTRTIRYVYAADGSQASAAVSETLVFTRQAKVNLVTGEVTFDKWMATDTTFDAKTSPVINGYITDRKEVPAKTGVQATDTDSEEIVKYTKLGHYVPNVPVPNFPDNPYPNDPDDPTQPEQPGNPNYPVIPIKPGYTPYDPEGNPLQPVVPGNPTQGYIPPAPVDPTKDTPVNYLADIQKAVIDFVQENQDSTTRTPMTSIDETGETGLTIPATGYQRVLDGYLNAGYAVVSDDFKGTKTFDTDSNRDQTFTVVLKERLEPIGPNIPFNPGQPVDQPEPNKPNPNWPESVRDFQTTKDIHRIIKYRFEDGSQASVDVTDAVRFEHTAKVNLVTGVIIDESWTAVDGDTTFDAVTSPVIAGYIADKAAIAEKTGLTQNSADDSHVIIYKVLGHYIPNMPVPNFPDNPYPNDPTDSTKPKQPSDPDYPVIPHNPGYTPVDPNTNTPLTPVVPNDPSKGYIPPTPEDPTKDTPINYEADNQKAVINFLTETDRQLSQLTETGKSEEAIPSADYTSALVDYFKAGYALVSDDFGGHQVFDKDKLADQIFTIILRERIEPFDPSNPPVPGQPVEPNDPSSPVWPDNVKDQSGTETVTRTVKYVYAKDGSQASAPVSETLTFTRQAKVNLVTGEVTFDEWTATDTIFDAVTSPVIAGFIADKAKVAEVTGVQVKDPDSEEVVKYTKLGRYVPNVPVPNFPANAYPNDPTDPTKPKQPEEPDYPVIPYTPGYTPINPNTNMPLTPVDPNDPSKGYIPPIPEDPIKDTPINYVPNLPEKEVPNEPAIPEKAEMLAQSAKAEGETPIAEGPAVTAKELPKTGDKGAQPSLVGLLALFVGSILAFGKKRKDEK